MNDRIRISDADRERVAARLREHFAEGRLTSDELDERIAAALNARTAGDLRHVMADLPGAAPVPPPAWQAPPWAAGRWAVYPRRPRMLPLALLALLAVLLLPGAGLLFLIFFKLLLVFLLVACVAAVIAAVRFRRRVRRFWRSGPGAFGRQYEEHGRTW